jgi:hypothetical protein
MLHESKENGGIPISALFVDGFDRLYLKIAAG